jgi:hypothetical protein
MAKFGKPAEDDDGPAAPPSQPAPPPAAVIIEQQPAASPPPITPAADNTVSFDDGASKDQSDKEQEHWVKAYWRPAMGWLYMVICFMDFVGFPAITMFLPVIEKGFGIQMAYTPWVSLTLSNGGLIHMAFGAILGVAAYGRTQEKVNKSN